MGKIYLNRTIWVEMAWFNDEIPCIATNYFSAGILGNVEWMICEVLADPRSDAFFVAGGSGNEY
jgi:hypothetical protein